MKQEKDNKVKKEKVKYYDDGRTIADMSGLDYGRRFSSKGTTSTPKEIWNTYWTAVRMMFKPMLVVIGFLCVIFGLAYIFFSILA